MEQTSTKGAPWRASRVARALATFALTATLCGSGSVPSFAAASVNDTAAVGDRSAGMPAPVAFAPPTELLPTVRLQGPQRLYRFDAAGNVTRERNAAFGASTIVPAGDGPRTFSGRQYVQLSGPRFAGWWVEAPDAQPQTTAEYTPETPVELRSGVTLGIRFYAGGTVRVRQPVRLNSATTFSATESASFGGRQFVLMATGPLAGRWVSVRRTRVAGAQLAAGPAAARAAAPAAAPAVAPTAPPPVAFPPAPTVASAATWKGVVLVYPGTDVTYTRSDGTDYHLSATMDTQMHDLVLDTLGRFKSSVGVWSANLVNIDLDIVEVPHPITTLDRLPSGQYWVGPQAVAADMNEYAPAGRYDSIFVVWQARDDHEIIPVGGWGLSLPPGWWANGAGFSSVITPSDLWWWTNSVAPEEVFVHEWLHQVVYWSEEHGRLQLDLHAGASYGYQMENGTWRSWLSDIMTGRVWDTDHYTGVSPEMWAADQPTRP